jgi:hypothetical protein
LKNKIDASQAAILNEPEVRMAFGDYYYIDKTGQRTGQWADMSTSKPPTGYVFQEVFAKRFPRNSLFRNELLHLPSIKSVGLYDADMVIYEDWEFRVRFTYDNMVAFIQEPLSEYRLHEAGISRLPLAEHVRYIHLLFNKNKKLLSTLQLPDRLAALQAFLDLESRFSTRLCIEALKNLDLLEFRDHIVEQYRFRRHARNVSR